MISTCLRSAPAQAAPISTGAPGPARVGVINVERLIQESALGKEAFARVRKLNDQKKDEADKMAKDLQALKMAPVMEPYLGPAILSPRATGVIFHEIFGHRIEGQREKRDQPTGEHGG